MYDKFIEAGMSTPNTILGFAQSVLKMIEDDEMLNAGGSEVGWRLWNRLANPVLEHVIQVCKLSLQLKLFNFVFK